MLTMQVTQVIDCTPNELLRFVMDPDRYKFAFRARAAGIPGSMLFPVPIGQGVHESRDQGETDPVHEGLRDLSRRHPDRLPAAGQRTRRRSAAWRRQRLPTPDATRQCARGNIHRLHSRPPRPRHERPLGADYGLRAEDDDLAVLNKQTGARNVFGVADGALFALHGALSLPNIEKVAAYEPPLFLDQPRLDKFLGFMQQFNQQLAWGRLGDAIVTTIKGH